MEPNSPITVIIFPHYSKVTPFTRLGAVLCGWSSRGPPPPPPNLLEARFSNPCPVTALHARTSQTGHPSLRIPRIRQPRMSGHERIPVKRHQRERKKKLKKRAPSEPWEASYAEFCSYWPGLGGRSYWNYYFTSRDFHSIQTSCLADFTLRGTRHVFLVFFFFFKSELLYPVNMVQ